MLEFVVAIKLVFINSFLGYGLSTGSLFGGDQRIAPLIYDKFSCDGTESSLSDCSPNEYATIDPTCTTTAGATCGGMSIVVLLLSETPFSKALWLLVY